VKTKNKKFDAVKMMRNIRDKMSEKYLKNPEAFRKELDNINEKYGIAKKPRKITGQKKYVKAN